MENTFRIIIVAPKSTSKQSFRLDYAYWNFYIPLLELGHRVEFFDTSLYGNKELKLLIASFKPTLLFCVMTDSSYYCPDEPWETVQEETRKGNILTFNWFCDDSWRFDTFSKTRCTSFHYCSTPELKYVTKYIEIGYTNIRYATWHANPNLYSINKTKQHPISFIGRIDNSRLPYFEFLAGYAEVNNPKGVAFEDMVDAYAGSLAGLNFSRNSTGEGLQIKARAFEIPATKTVLVSEYVDSLEDSFIPGEEILVFHDNASLLECLSLLRDPDFSKKISDSGHARFLKDHTSHGRLKTLLASLQ